MYLNELDEQELVGKTINKIDVDGFGVLIVCTDGTKFEYNASDGGYSRWTTYPSNEDECDFRSHAQEFCIEQIVKLLNEKSESK